MSDVEAFRELIAHRLGLGFDDSKLGFLEEILERRMAATKSAPADYFALVGATGSREISTLAVELTVGETYFFRNADQFRALVDVIHELSRGGRPIRMLSAGCASGEEPYTMAILTADIPRVTIHAFDVNPAAIERARHGRYSTWSLRDTEPALRQRWFRDSGRELVLDDSIRSRVSFEVRNLADDDRELWQPEAYDVVFCRNVLMYMVPSVQRAIVERLEGSLAPDGFLFLGHAETLRNLSHGFHLCHTHGTFYYQRRARTEPAVAAPEPVAPPTPISTDESWVDVINRASGRVEELARRHLGVSQVPSTWDASEVLDLVSRERFADALDHVSRLPPERAHDPDVLILAAVVLANHGDVAAAEAASLRVLASDELHAGARYLLALCREQAGDLDGAVEHDQTAIYLDPEFAMPRLHLGMMARRRGDRALARRELARAAVLLEREEPARVLLFGGGFKRDALIALCEAQLAACEERR